MANAALKKKDLDMFRQLLSDEKKKILHHVEQLSHTSEAEIGNNKGDAADIASLETNQAALQKIGKRETYLLKKIEYALRKIDDGSYGECEECGDPIGVPRLKARPVAQLCIDCKTEQESKERRYTSRDEEEEEDDDMIDD